MFRVARLIFYPHREDHIASLISGFSFNSLVNKLAPVPKDKGERVRTVIISH